MTVLSNIRINSIDGTYTAEPIPHGPTITVCGGNSVGRVLAAGGFGTSSGWPAANRAIFFPFDMTEPFNCVKAFIGNGGTPAGNFDLGLYDEDGTRLASIGSTAQSGASDIQSVSLVYNITQRRVYFAMSSDSTSFQVLRTNSFTSTVMNGVGIKEMASAFPLPSTATFADYTSAAYLPVAGISKRSTI